MTNITRDELKRRLDRGEKIHLVDVLPRGQYEEGHLPGAISIPAREIPGKAPLLLRDKEAPIVTYCSGAQCSASEEAAEDLRSLGYNNVFEYKAGKEDWEKAGLPMQSAASKSDEGINVNQNSG
jgi:rhodanese-related sulfurtransferase